MMADLGECSEGFEGVRGNGDIEHIAMLKAVTRLRNSMIETQYSMPTLGEELDIDEDVVRMLFRLLDAIEDSYASLYLDSPSVGQIPDDVGTLDSVLRTVKGNILRGDPDKILDAAHAVTVSLFFAGGLPVLSIFTVAASFNFGAECGTNEMSLKLFVLEATRRFPPVLDVIYLEKKIGKKKSSLARHG